MKHIINKRQTDAQIVDGFKRCKENGSILPNYGWRTVANMLKTSEGRLKKLFPEGLPGSLERISAKTDEILIKESGELLEQQSITLGGLARRLKTKPRRLEKLLPTALKNMLLVSPLSAAPKEHMRSVRSLQKMNKILVTHKNKTGFLGCEVCQKTTFGPFNAKKALTIDHIYGHGFNGVEHLRVICRNCHAQTINHKRGTCLINMPDYLAEPNGKPVDYKTINMLHIEKAGSPGLLRYNQRLKQQQLVNGAQLAQKKASLENQLKKADGKNVVILDRLISFGLKKAACECCGVVEWRGFKIGPFLELHHSDGDNTNNNISNLEVICPNCHLGKHTLDGDAVKSKKLKSGAAFYAMETYNETRCKDVLEARRVYAVLKAPNAPPSAARCARAIGMDAERFDRIAGTFWPSLLKTKKNTKVTTYWLSDSRYTAKIKVVYDNAFNKASPFYADRPVAHAVKLVGFLYGISLKTWKKFVDLLKKDFYVQRGLNPFEHLFSIETLEVPEAMPPKELL